jgi:hypothetical protein
VAAHWVARTDPWYDQRPVYCALTGRLIPGRAWIVEIAGRSLSFSDPESEQLYRRYILGEAPPASPPGPIGHRRG